MTGCACFWNRWFKELRAGEAVPDERSLRRPLSELLSREWLAFFVNCLEQRMCVGGEGLFEEDMEMMFVKVGFVGGGFHLSLDDYGGA